MTFSCHSCHKIPKMETIGHADAFVMVRIANEHKKVKGLKRSAAKQEQRTTIKNNTEMGAIWEEELNFHDIVWAEDVKETEVEVMLMYNGKFAGEKCIGHWVCSPKQAVALEEKARIPLDPHEDSEKTIGYSHLVDDIDLQISIGFHECVCC